MGDSNPQSSPSATTKTTLRKAIIGSLSRSNMQEAGSRASEIVIEKEADKALAAIDNYITQRVIEELEKAQKVKYIQYDMPVYLRNRISELKESLKGGIDE